MKLMYFTLFLVLFLSCNKYNKIKVFYVEDPNVETIFNINCNNFITYFKEDIKTIDNLNITNNNFFKLINSLEKEEDGYEINTRCLIIVENSEQNKNDTLCMDNFHIRYNGQVFKVSKKLKSMIWKQ